MVWQGTKAKKDINRVKISRKNNFLVLLVFLGTVLASLFVIVVREWPKLAEKIGASGTTVINFTKPTISLFSPRLEKTGGEIRELLSDLQGTYGIYVYNLTTGEEFGIKENEVFPAASLIKLPVFAAVYQDEEKGNLSLTTKYILKEADKVGGAGSMYYAKPGTVYTYQKMLELMGKQSDNTAFSVFTKLLGKEKIQEVIDYLGMKNTSFAENKTTPADIGRFFREMYWGNQGNRGYQGKILENLTDTIWEDRIPAGVPEEIRVSHKIGTEVGVISDAGIVFGKKPYILAILSRDVLEKEAKEALPKISLMIYERIND